MGTRTLPGAALRDRGAQDARIRLNRAAAVQAWLAGLGFGVPCAYGIYYFAEHGAVATVLGFPAYGGGPFEDVGVTTSVPLLGAFLGVCVLECVAGWWLWVGRRAGRSLSWALLPAELVFWSGFALPFGPILGAARILLARKDSR